MNIEEKAKAYAFETFKENASKITTVPFDEVVDMFEQAYLQGAKDANEWVMCKDRLPPMGKRVLVAATNPAASRVLRYISKRIPHDLTDPDCDKWHWIKVSNDENILAWLPLPEFNPAKG